MESAAAQEPVAFIAKFVMDEAQQRRCASVPRARQLSWLMLLLLPIAPLLFLIYPIVNLAGGTLPGIIAVVLLATPIVLAHVLLKRRFRRQNLVPLQAHPVLGAFGPWELTVSREHATLVTLGGEQTWPLAAIAYHAVEGQDTIIYLEPELPIVIPAQGKYARMSAQLRRWLVKIAAEPRT
jgi:hypothetical protein